MSSFLRAPVGFTVKRPPGFSGGLFAEVPSFQTLTRRRQLHRGNRFFGAPDRPSHVAEVGQSGLVSVAEFRVDGGGSRILYYCNVKTLFLQLTHVGNRAEVGGHTGQKDREYVSLPDLKSQVVGLRIVDLLGTGHDGLSIVNVGLVLLQPVGARFGKAFSAERTLAVEHSDLAHHVFRQSAELPTLVCGVVVRRAK